VPLLLLEGNPLGGAEADVIAWPQACWSVTHNGNPEPRQSCSDSDLSERDSSTAARSQMPCTVSHYSSRRARPGVALAEPAAVANICVLGPRCCRLASGPSPWRKTACSGPDAAAEALNLPLSCSRFYMVRMLIKCFDDGEAESWIVTALGVLRTQGGQVLVLLTRTPKHKFFSICINSRRF
jgi:hypothetical protein